MTGYVEEVNRFMDHGFRKSVIGSEEEFKQPLTFHNERI